MLRKWVASFIVVVAAVFGSWACTELSAKPRPAEVVLSLAAAQTSVDSLIVVAEWQASSVGVTNGAVVYPVRWLKNGLQTKFDTTSVLVDTARFARAPIGRADTIQFFVRALYTVNGRQSQEATVVRYYTNPDLQTPAIPVIIRVDTLP